MLAGIVLPSVIAGIEFLMLKPELVAAGKETVSLDLECLWLMYAFLDYLAWGKLISLILPRSS